MKLLGRDFVRLLEGAVNINDFRILLDLIIYTPSAIDPSFHGVQVLWDITTPTEHIVSLLTQEIEDAIWFICHNVPAKFATPYISRFRHKFLPFGSDLLIPDLIRYCCIAIHPPNAILGSDIVQR